MKFIKAILFSALFYSFSSAQNQCLGHYKASIDYNNILAQVMMSMSPEMQKEILTQVDIINNKDLSQQSTTKLENMFFEYFAKAQKENRFDQVFNQMTQMLLAQPQFKNRIGNIHEDKKQELLETFKMGLLGEIQLRQYYGKNFLNDIWAQIRKRINFKIGDITQWIQLNVSQKIQKIAVLTGSVTKGVKEVEYLINGPESFAKRDQLIENAKKTIHVLTWSVYDDATGIKFADQMISKKKQGLDVKIIVDALTAMKSGHNQQLIRMQQNGIEVIYSRNPGLMLSGQHRKAMIVDSEYVIAGGMNFGDVYSHLEGNVKWRDTDIYFSGSLGVCPRTQNFPDKSQKLYQS